MKKEEILSQESQSVVINNIEIKKPPKSIYNRKDVFLRKFDISWYSKIKYMIEKFFPNYPYSNKYFIYLK